MSRDFEQTKGFAERFFSYDHVNSWSLLYIHSAQAFIAGLVAFWLSQRTKDPVWAERGGKAKFQIKKWNDSCEWNFQSKLILIQAQEAYAYNDNETAKSMYDKAISSAKEHR